MLCQFLFMKITHRLQLSEFRDGVDMPNARLRELYIAFPLPPVQPKFYSPSLPTLRTAPAHRRLMIYACVCKNCSIFCQRKAFLSVFPSLIASLVWMASMSDALKSNIFSDFSPGYLFKWNPIRYNVLINLTIYARYRYEDERQVKAICYLLP